MIKLKFRTITPLHISNGDEIAQNLHYIVNGKQIFVIDTLKASYYLAKNKIFDFSKSYTLENIRSIIDKRKNELAEFAANYSIKMESEFEKYLQHENRVGRTYIHEFINVNGKYYIPASSIKGALLTVLHKSSLGINPQNALINDKFVIHDSDYLDSNFLKIFRTISGRPPINIMCLTPNTDFGITIQKINPDIIPELRKKLESYSIEQISKAKKNIKEYIDPEKGDSGANIFNNLLTDILETRIDSDEYLINLGFGGGSWFKIFSDASPPKFLNRKTRRDEKAHTTFGITEEDKQYHLGWCKLKIEE